MVLTHKQKRIGGNKFAKSWSANSWKIPPDQREVGKHNALSGDTAPGRTGSSIDGEYSTPTLRLRIYSCRIPSAPRDRVGC